MERAQKGGNMFSFFKNRHEDTTDDMRSAQFILLFQSIIEKNVLNCEIKELRKFYKEMKYPEFMNHQDIAIDYIYFLLNKRRRFPGGKKFLEMEEKQAIIRSFQIAVQRGLIIIGVDSYHFSLMQEVSEED